MTIKGYQNVVWNSFVYTCSKIVRVLVEHLTHDSTCVRDNICTTCVVDCIRTSISRLILITENSLTPHSHHHQNDTFHSCYYQQSLSCPNVIYKTNIHFFFFTFRHLAAACACLQIICAMPSPQVANPFTPLFKIIICYY